MSITFHFVKHKAVYEVFVRFEELHASTVEAIAKKVLKEALSSCGLHQEDARSKLQWICVNVRVLY